MSIYSITVVDWPFTVEEFEKFKDLMKEKYPRAKVYSLHEE